MMRKIVNGGETFGASRESAEWPVKRKKNEYYFSMRNSYDQK